MEKSNNKNKRTPAESFNFFFRQPWFREFAFKFINKILSNVISSPIVSMAQQNVPTEFLKNQMWSSPIVYKCRDTMGKTLIVLIRSGVDKFSYSQQIIYDGSIALSLFEKENEWLNNERLAPVHIIQLIDNDLCFGESTIAFGQKDIKDSLWFDKQFSIHNVKYSKGLVSCIEILLKMVIIEEINKNPLAQVICNDTIEKINRLDYESLSYALNIIQGYLENNCKINPSNQYAQAIQEIIDLCSDELDKKNSNEQEYKECLSCKSNLS